MLLAIDIGNTNIHMGLWKDNRWWISWRARTVVNKMPDEYAVLVRNFLRGADVGYGVITGVVIGSVVPSLTEVFAQLSQRYIRHEPIIVTHQSIKGLEVAIDQPEQAGADRLANAMAIVHLYTYPAIVVDFGTATNFDVISADGNYVGGAIAPGIGLAHDALVSRAARLHQIDLLPPPDAIGRNTIHAMQSGLFWGYIGLIEGLVTRIKDSLGHEGSKVYATGGLAHLINEHTNVIGEIVPQLTLDGLRLVYEMR